MHLVKCGCLGHADPFDARDLVGSRETVAYGAASLSSVCRFIKVSI